MSLGGAKWNFSLSLSLMLAFFEFLFSGYMLPNEKPAILALSMANFLFYLFFFIKNGMKVKEKSSLVCFLLSFIVSIFFVKIVWFSGYLCLNPFNVLFEGNFHADTLSHSALAESIISNGYPSLLFDTKEMFHYHFGSHYVMAAIASVLNLHAFSVYNYIYPVVFLPLFFLSLFTAIEKIIDRRIEFKEVLFIVLMGFVGFMPKNFEDSVGFFKENIFVSESFCIGLIFLFLFIILIERKNIYSIRNSFLVFAFIFICSSMKISIGILILCFCGWYTLRSKGLKKSIPYGVFWGISLSISFFLFNERVGSASLHQFFFLHYYIEYVTKDGIMYFLFLFLWPAIFGFACKCPFRNIIKKIRGKKILIEESMLVTTIISLIPGMLLYIEGGSAFYFFAVMYPIFIIYFVAVGGIDKAAETLKKNIILSAFLIVIFGGTVVFNCLYALGVIYVGCPKFHENVTMIYANNLFKELEAIREDTKKERMKMGIIITKDCKLFKIYGNHNLRSLSYFVQAYTGIPVYGMYERKNGNIALINGNFVQTDIKPLYFGLDYDKVFSGKSVDEKMKDDGIEKVIYLSN